MKKNKREISPEFQPFPDRRVGSTLYGFAGNTTLLSVVPKKNKAVILGSSMHHSIETGDRKNKPEIVCYYNKTKAGVDLLDMKCAIYSSSHRTRRWPLAIFYQMLGISCINSFILYILFQGNPLVTRYSFIQDLAMELIKPHMTRRLEVPNLPRDIKATIQEHIWKKGPQNQNESIPNDKLEKRKSCSKCPPAKERKTNYKCINRDKPICLECSRKLWTSCATNM
uniref:PiggyBac transposable element-derived protein domain-containing protein n=1 Tax=Clastoptera arizonana TaxID=38151 RepID=A0A1B6DRR7_9HEMI